MRLSPCVPALCALLAASISPASAQSERPLDVLVVTAHSDDETLMAGAIHRLAHELGADVDLLVVTDGGGGYEYAILGERHYGIALASEPDARRNLPLVRKREVIGSAGVLGIRNVFFLDELDHEYTTDVDTVLRHVWDAEFVRGRISTLLDRGSYDLVLTILPTPQTHGHHKGAAILALEAIAELPVDRQPLVLGADLFDARQMADPNAPAYVFSGLEGYNVTAVDPAAPVFRFDRRQPLEPTGLLDYRYVAHLAMAEHRSQGSLAGYFGWGDYEFYWFYAINDPARLAEAAALFARLDENPWREGRRYGRED